MATLAPATRATVVRVATVVVVVVVILGIAVAIHHTDTGEPAVRDTGAPDLVQLRQPADGSHVLRQAQVGITLAPGWTAVLVVNGVEIPETQVHREPALYQVLFTPEDGKVIEQFPPGENKVSAIVWRISQNRGQSRTINWHFFVD